MTDSKFGHYVALDIESYGLAPQGPIVEVAFVIASNDPNRTDIKERVSWCIAHDDKEMHPETKTFWDRFPEQKKRIQLDAVHPDKAWHEIVTWRNNLAARYGTNLIWLTDNAAYDVASIDKELNDRFGRPSIRYETDGTYQWVQDPIEQLQGTPSWVQFHLKQQVKQWMDRRPGQGTTHQALYDAEQILFQQKAMDQWKQKESLFSVVWAYASKWWFGK